MTKSTLERTFETHWIQLGGPDYITEYRFHDERKWRFDVAWPLFKIAIELQGATWSGGKHNRGQGYENDCEKLMAATLDGWRVFWLTSTMIKNNPHGHLMPIIQFIRDQQSNEQDDYEIISLA